MEDYVILVLGIVFLSVTVSITGIITTHLGKQSKLKLEALKYEIELEKSKKENYILETEKLRLEIEQTRQQLSLDQPTQIPHETLISKTLKNDFKLL